MTKDQQDNLNNFYLNQNRNVPAYLAFRCSTCLNVGTLSYGTVRYPDCDGKGYELLRNPNASSPLKPILDD